MLFIAILIGTIIHGVLIGYASRKIEMKHINHVVLFFICLLLFIIGVEIGQDKQVLTNLPKLGYVALLIATLTALGSMLMAWLLWRRIRTHERKKGGEL